MTRTELESLWELSKDKLEGILIQKFDLLETLKSEGKESTDEYHIQEDIYCRILHLWEQKEMVQV